MNKWFEFYSWTQKPHIYMCASKTIVFFSLSLSHNSKQYRALLTLPFQVTHELYSRDRKKIAVLFILSKFNLVKGHKCTEAQIFTTQKHTADWRCTLLLVVELFQPKLITIRILARPMAISYFQMINNIHSRAMCVESYTLIILKKITNTSARTRAYTHTATEICMSCIKPVFYGWIIYVQIQP